MIKSKAKSEKKSDTIKDWSRLKFVTGCPPKYKTVKDMQIKIVDYFDNTEIEKLTITWLSLHLGFTSRQALINYQGKPEFVDTIKKAKQMIEHSYELDLKAKGNTGTIFALKNFDWVDKQVNENTNTNLDYQVEDSEKFKDLLKTNWLI